MHRLIAISFALFITVPLCAQTPGQRREQTNTSTWSANLFGSTVFSLDVPGPTNPSGLSFLTPDQNIRVARIEAFAVQGPWLQSREGNVGPCPIRPQIIVTNGSVTRAVTLSPPSGGFGTPSATDSGPLNLEFRAHTPVSLLYMPGLPNLSSSGYCYVFNVNVTVQYRTD